MKITFYLIFGILICTALLASTGPQFDDYFIDQTMRIDFYFTGTKTQSCISLDAVYRTSRWAGSVTNLLDTLNLGSHLIRIYDYESEKLIYSRGFSTLFDEWQSTDEAAQEIFRTFSFSMLIPFPKKSVIVALCARDPQNHFIQRFRTTIEPDSRFVQRECLSDKYQTKKLFYNGDIHRKVDILLLPEGYTKNEMRLFRQHCRHYLEVLFNVSPFKENANKFNVWTIEIPAEESGIDNPREGIFKRTVFDLTFNSLDLDRYVLTLNNKQVRDVADQVPYDQIIFLFNSDKYGGGGIFNLFSTCYSIASNPEQITWPDYVFVHEFGHSFAGLADEYYTSSTPYNDLYPAGIEPWEPNITELLNAPSVKWQKYVTPGISIPTPWDKTAYDKAALEKTGNLESILKNDANYGKVGAFQGAGYASEGLYRPCLDCIMFSRNQIAFCPVCQGALTRMIHFYTE